MSAHLVGAFLGLVAAATWGAGDFSGGLATRRGNQFQVLSHSTLVGLAILWVLALALSEPLPSPTSALWAIAAGASGAFGLACLYYTLSLGGAAIVAPTAAVVGTTLPVIVSFFTQGLPELITIVGFIFAIAGIWLVTKPAARSATGYRPGLLLAFLAGLGTGAYLALIAQVEASTVLAPLALAKAASFVVALLLMRLRSDLSPLLVFNPIALLAGTLDAGGNVFFLLAEQFTRLDIASVLASMYAVTTVILARALLKETVSKAQWTGVISCMVAIALIII